jgi:hypothetical protein
MSHSDPHDIYDRILEKVEKHLLGDQITFLTELDRVCKKLFGKKYSGTFPSDMIPKLTLEVPYAIINLDKTGSPGSHWVALARGRGGVGVYDSFGRTSRKILPSVYNSNNGKILDSDYDSEQHVSEDNCGARCCAWLIFVDRYGLDRALLI